MSMKEDAGEPESHIYSEHCEGLDIMKMVVWIRMEMLVHPMKSRTLDYHNGTTSNRPINIDDGQPTTGTCYDQRGMYSSGIMERHNAEVHR